VLYKKRIILKFCTDKSHYLVLGERSIYNLLNNTKIQIKSQVEFKNHQPLQFFLKKPICFLGIFLSGHVVDYVLDFTPSLQCFKLLIKCAAVKVKLKFFNKK